MSTNNDNAPPQPGERPLSLRTVVAGCLIGVPTLTGGAGR
jgi:hypothetical protein